MLGRMAIGAALALSAAACATPGAETEAADTYTPPPVLAADVRIPFADMGGVRSWNALPDGSLLLESRQNKFYRATFFGACPDLSFVSTIGFVNDQVGSLDRFSGVVVRDQVCRFRTLDEVRDPRALPQEPAATDLAAPAPEPGGQP